MSRPGQIRFLSRAARLYDPVVRWMGFAALWEGMAAHAAPEADGFCLDVCSGTGGLALALARRGARVVGVDASSGMLACAARKVRASGPAWSVQLLQMDARHLAFPDASFPLVTCCMALHEMAEGERDRVLGELRRVARGRVLVADYRVPRSRTRSLWFRVRHLHEYLESDDFGGYAACDLGGRLAAVGFDVDEPRDVGPYRIWPCRVGRP